ncbi:MAG: RpiB/LacA/LacB family sugar-phosphate isomerase [Planctomycetes bacterium]|nr:RpiB/LacA/LacB family sugar-phosphate isomerase [Planctomycetota bacterium]
MKIAFGCDPNATQFKDDLMTFAKSLGHECTDYGSDDPIYANVAVKVAREVAARDFDRGILLCGTGIGMAIAANKIKGAYAANISNVYQAERAQLSNNANIITLGSQVMGIELAKALVRTYLANTYDPKSRSHAKVLRICQYEGED